MEQTRVIITRQEIAQKIDEIAADIRRDYQGKNPLLVGALKGCFVFMSDLVRAINMPLEIDFMRVCSYGAGTESSGQIKVTQKLEIPARGRDILVVEDIVDTGLTARFVLDYVKQQKPASVKLCALFDKPSRRQTEVTIDYLGFAIPDEFVVGYGLDCNEKFRYLPDLCALEVKK